jgi:hypothetical protein
MEDDNANRCSVILNMIFMKKILKLVMVIILVAGFASSQAQIKSEYLFGINLSTMSVKKNGISYNPDMPVGFHFGGFFEIPVTDNFDMQPCLLFSAKGSNYVIDTLDYTISPIYIEIPVNALYSFGSDHVKVSLAAGPYVAFGIGGYKIESGGNLKTIRYGSGENQDLKTFDAGVNLGARLSIGSLMISVQYGLGLVNISPVAANGSEMKNQVIGISVSSGGKGLSRRFGR